MVIVIVIIYCMVSISAIYSVVNPQELSKCNQVLTVLLDDCHTSLPHISDQLYCLTLIAYCHTLHVC